MPTIGAQFTRHIPLHGSYNIRDIGGYATCDGKQTRWRTLLRADSLHRLTSAAQRQLIDLDVRTTIDLRHGAELREAPSVFVGSESLRYVHLPLLEEPVLSASRTPLPVRTLAESYVLILETRAAQLVEVMACLVEPVALPALVHCTAGKDRTGLVIALVLGAVGVPDATIAGDYELSSTYLTGAYFREARLRAERRGIAWEVYQQQLVCPGSLMLQTLRWLRDTHGGVGQYLLDNGLPRESLRDLRGRLVEP